MSNILTHSLSYKAKNIADYFITLAFLNEDILKQMTVYTDVKGTKVLQKLTRPSNITVAATASSFSATGTMTLTEKEITVKGLQAEVEQNGKAFIDSIFQEASKSGYKENDVALMTEPQLWNEIVLPILAKAIQIDKQRQSMFGDTTLEVLSGSLPNSNPTAVGDVNNNVYDGLFKKLIAAVDAGTIPSAQKIAFAASTPGVAQSGTYTTNISTGVLTLILNGTTYSETYDSSADNTTDKWIASHAATVNARAGINGLTIIKGSSAAVGIVARKGQGYTIDHTTGGGTWTATSEVAATRAVGMADDKSIAVMKSLVDNMSYEMLEFQNELVFYATRSAYRNYVDTLQSTTGVESAFKMLQDGKKQLHYEGFPIFERADWDMSIASIQNGVYPHRILMTTPKNLIFSTDGANDDDMIETWYNPDEKKRRFRIEYKAAMDYLHAELIMIAYGD